VTRNRKAADKSQAIVPLLIINFAHRPIVVKWCERLQDPKCLVRNGYVDAQVLQRIYLALNVRPEHSSARLVGFPCGQVVSQSVRYTRSYAQINKNMNDVAAANRWNGPHEMCPGTAMSGFDMKSGREVVNK
jgi:hypothetical protein